MRDLLSAGIFWTPGTAVETHASGLDPFCRLTTAQGAAIASAAGRDRRGWAWMAPRESSLTIAEALSGRFVADMEVPSPRTPASQLGAFWRGHAGEVSFARQPHRGR